jgi:predicted dehydrogenase
MIGLQRRFDANFLRVKQAIEEKEVGDTIIVSNVSL